MISGLLKKFVGTRNDRLVKSYRKQVAQINALEAEIEKLDDAALRAKTAEFKTRLQQGETLDSLLVEAFAVVRETAKRTLGMRHFDVQLIGGMVLNSGKIAEMRTGEGKTLASTLPAYLNALSGKSVHIVTVNDYLAKRDATWMGPVFDFLGLTVGINLPDMSPEDKKAAYAADITYGTNNEFGFDYLRDNMTFELEQRVQRDLAYAVIDEVDSILIDEARTPLIISGHGEESSDLYVKIKELIPKLKQQIQTEEQKEEDVTEENKGDYTLDEKNKQAYLTERGHQKIEKMLVDIGVIKAGESLYDLKNISLMHYVNASLRANTLYHRDVDYIVQEGEVLIVDEHTGRLMAGRRWSEGLHQAVEAKEGVDVQLENQTLATITFQNYFRLYQKLSGMTGTADTEAFELQKIYGLEVVIIPTNKPMIRQDEADKVYLTAQAKYEAIVEEIKKRNEKQQPILVGTTSVESSELLSQLLKQQHIKHQVLNAKQHEREAHIVAEAGRPGAVTIATNMAGRGTDIVLGGNLEMEMNELDNPSEDEFTQRKKQWQQRHAEVIAAGGLHVLGAERNESRRIDNQLRGRSGRQGDPGSSQFYLSMEDNLLRIFGGERMSNMMRKLGVKDADVIQHGWLSRSIEKAQRRVENLNFDIRKNLLEYDDVANDQRKVIYDQRLRLLQADNIKESVELMREEVVADLLAQFIPPQSMPEQWNIEGLEKQLQEDFALSLPIANWLEEDEHLHEETLRDKIAQEIAQAYAVKETASGEAVMRDVEKSVMLQLLDQHWKEHLAAMEHLRQGIHLRGYAQKNPTQEYKRESFELFKELMGAIKYEVIATLSKLEIVTKEQMEWQQMQQLAMPKMTFHHAEMDALPNIAAQQAQPPQTAAEMPRAPENSAHPFVREQQKVGRNELCPCGSAKKYKQCHGKL